MTISAPLTVNLDSCATTTRCVETKTIAIISIHVQAQVCNFKETRNANTALSLLLTYYVKSAFLNKILKLQRGKSMSNFLQGFQIFNIQSFRKAIFLH